MPLPAWYHGTREEFLAASNVTIANQLAGRAASESLEIEAHQNDEWKTSIDLLQKTLDSRIPILREVLQSVSGELIRHVVLEFDFRRRGLRMDCILFGDGVLFVIEFKRTRIQAADRDQVMTYAVNLLEFHSATRKLASGDQGMIVVPIIALTNGVTNKPIKWPGLGEHSWNALTKFPLECDASGLTKVLDLAFEHRRSELKVAAAEWLQSPFSPSSSILDATLSLYGNHEVSAINEHAVPKAQIDASILEIREVIDRSLASNKHQIVFLSGAPGAGKTLVGLDIVMRGEHASEAVFVTGNAPLVEVLNEALGKSYKVLSGNSSRWSQTGYHRTDAKFVISASSYKIVKAHSFLGSRGSSHGQQDGRILVFDEAQRTYKAGRTVRGEALSDHEADLILQAQMNAYRDGGSVVIALVGHNQAINSGEMGILAWLEAAERQGWGFSISDETLNLAEVTEKERWAKHPQRDSMKNGHLHHSMRYYRNAKIEEWVAEVLEGSPEKANSMTAELEENSDPIWITRSLDEARRWAKSKTIGNERSGLIASGQARRLAAEGLFVELKPDIATWMLAPSSDIRSSNALETVQNQFQVQGLELDYCVVCWDVDLRRVGEKWAAYKLSGPKWNEDKLIAVAKNSYRVLLTRARKGMVIFVPVGDQTGEDETRKTRFYDDVWEFLMKCGAKALPSG